MRVGKDCNISPRASFYNDDMIEIGNHVRIDDFAVISGGSGIKIGNYCHVSCHCSLFGGGVIELEDFVTLSTNVNLFSQSDDYSGRSLAGPHFPPEYKPYFKTGSILLCRHVLVGCGSVILPGVKVGNGTAIGALSMVKEDCESWSIYAGVPARIIRGREKQIIELEKKWLQSTPMSWQQTANTSIS